MKRVTASDARKNWFRLLDEVAGGEVVVIKRKGRRIVLHREDLNESKFVEGTRDYSDLIRAPGADRADEWHWEWTGSELEFAPAEGKR